MTDTTRANDDLERRSAERYAERRRAQVREALLEVQARIDRLHADVTRAIVDLDEGHATQATAVTRVQQEVLYALGNSGVDRLTNALIDLYTAEMWLDRATRPASGEER